MLRRNRLRELLQAGKPSVGTHILSAWPTITELVGQTGTWDYIEFVAEYTPWTMHDLDNLGRAIELFPDFTGMIKIEQDTRGHLAMRAIGAGIQNVLFADVRTPAEALQCARRASDLRRTPRRGDAARRADGARGWHARLRPGARRRGRRADDREEGSG